MPHLALIAVLLLLGTSAQAAPMKCSGEQTACVAACQRILDTAQATNCVAACRGRFNYCRTTGCWDNGRNRYCGLLRQ
jgi:hypothetical protein